MESEDPLLELVIDAVEVDRQRIATALRGVIVIDKSGTVLPAPGYQPLSAHQKVLAYLLGRKVAALLELAEREAIGPKDLAASAGLAEGTVYPTVRKLHGERLVSQDVDSRYYLSPHQVGTAIEALTTTTNDHTSPDDEDNSNIERQPKARSGGRRKQASKKPSKRAPTADSGSSTVAAGRAERKKPSGSGFSPTTEIREMVSSGFFAEPKGLADVQRRLKDKQGRDVPVTTLSPVFTRLLREGVLDRTRNSEGTYEYVSAQGS